MNDNAADAGDNYSGGDWDVVIVGAGPTGLTLANHLGMLKVRTLVVERLPALIDYPRGVGIDDESLRTFQAAGLVEAVRRHTVPNQILRFIDRRGRVLAAIDPVAQPFGWPRRNGFIQPRVDAELASGLKRFAHVQLRMNTSIVGFVDNGASVDVTPSGHAGTLKTRFLVGCDGGRSEVRHKLGLTFDGKSESTKWLVIDVANDPVGQPNAAMILDDDFPHVTMGLPHGVRRYEFMVPFGADEALYDTPDMARKLLTRVLPAEVSPDIIRHRVYTHHARIAPTFRKGNVMLAGDAAHVMPVWQGQGFNTGIRDAANLAWKLAQVVQGRAGAALLDSYTTERHPHALAMINMSVLTGQIFVPSSAVLRAARNYIGPILARIGPVRRYMAEMRFKPMPFFNHGVVLHPGRPDVKGLVGKMFIQPWVATGAGRARFDDVIGLRFAVVAWSMRVDHWLDAASVDVLERLDACCIVVRPDCQDMAEDAPQKPAGRGLVVADADGAVKRWFDTAPGSVVVLRPDRVVFAVCDPWQLPSVLAQLASLMQMPMQARLPEGSSPGMLPIPGTEDTRPTLDRVGHGTNNNQMETT